DEHRLRSRHANQSLLALGWATCPAEGVMAGSHAQFKKLSLGDRGQARRSAGSHLINGWILVGICRSLSVKNFAKTALSLWLFGSSDAIKNDDPILRRLRGEI